MLRNWLLDQLGGAPNVRVLDLFAGEGHLYDACYASTKAHLAFEWRRIERPNWLQGDNRTLLKSRAQGWDLYDLDSYSSPWLLANDVCRLREDGIFGMAFTCGIFRSLCAGEVSGFIRQRIGLNELGNDVGIISRWYFDIIRMLMRDWSRHGVRVIEAKHVNSTLTHRTHYFGAILEKTSISTPCPRTQGVTARPKPPSKVVIKKASTAKTI